MSLQTRLSSLITAIGADIKSIQRARPIQRYIAGRFYALQPGANLSTMSTTEALLAVGPCVISEAVTFDQFSVDVTAAGGAGSVIRIVIYNDTGFCEPNVPVYDSGGIASASIGIKASASGVTLQPGLYWIGGVVQGASATRPTVRRILSDSSGIQPGSSAHTAGNQMNIAHTLGVTGAPPNPWVRGNNTAANDVMRIVARVAA